MSIKDFDVKEGFADQKAKDFIKFVEDKFEIYRGEGIVGYATYGVLDALFEEFTNDLDFGYVVGFSNEDNTMKDDINFDFNREMYNLLVSSHTQYGYEDIGYMTTMECAEQFWSMLAKFTLSGLPTDFDKAKEFVCLKVASIFNGFNVHGLRYHLWYVEFDDDKKEFVRTEELGDHLLVGKIPLELNF